MKLLGRLEFMEKYKVEKPYLSKACTKLKQTILQLQEQPHNSHLKSKSKSRNQPRANSMEDSLMMASIVQESKEDSLLSVELPQTFCPHAIEAKLPQVRPKRSIQDYQNTRCAQTAAVKHRNKVISTTAAAPGEYLATSKPDSARHEKPSSVNSARHEKPSSVNSARQQKPVNSALQKPSSVNS